MNNLPPYNMFISTRIKHIFSMIINCPFSLWEYKSLHFDLKINNLTATI